MDKKGSILVPLTIAFAIFTLIALLVLVFAKGAQFDKHLGDRQLELFNIYQSGEKPLYFVDEAAAKSADKALLEVAANGLKASTDCGMYDTFRLWAMGSMDGSCSPVQKSCYPDDGDSHRKYFAYVSRQNLYGYIDDYNSNPDNYAIPKDYADFELVESSGKLQLVGTANAPVVVSLVDVKTGNPAVEYGMKPSFRQDVDIDFVADAQNLVATSEQLIKKAEGDARSIIEAADNLNGLDWDEGFSYKKEQYSCTHDVGSCSCCVIEETCESGEVDPETGEFVCTKKGSSIVPVGDGTLYESVPYYLVDIPMSVKVLDGGSHRSFYVYDGAAKKVVPKEVEYRFGLDWVEAHPEDSSTFCSCGNGSPCSGLKIDEKKGDAGDAGGEEKEASYACTITCTDDSSSDFCTSTNLDGKYEVDDETGISCSYTCPSCPDGCSDGSCKESGGTIN
ncbi:hypothetical protein HYU18_01725 [Candidatus Woesearchaeota archaeon]|nr:hypothetical protein [Candidatus Woesearchaeota archaeon]